MEHVKFLLTRLTLLVAVAMLACLSSCSKDDGKDPEKPKEVMHLVEISINDGAETFTDFKYDSKDRIVSFRYTEKEDWRNEGNPNTCVRTYEYNPGVIFSNDEGGYCYVGTDTYNVEDGFIVNDSNCDEWTYENGCIHRWSEQYGEPTYSNTPYVVYQWEGGNPVKEISMPNSNSADHYVYNDLPCYIGNLQTLLDDYVSAEYIGGSHWDPFLMQSGYFGKLPKNLVSKIVYRRSETYFDYTLNSKNYPTRIVATDDEGQKSEMTLVWK